MDSSFVYAGIATLGSTNNGGANPVAPRLELFGGSRPEGVGSAEYYRTTLRNEKASEFASCRRLAGSIHANDHEDGGPASRLGDKFAFHTGIDEAQQG